MRVLMYEKPLCTLEQLYTTYTIDDFYDFLEMIDAQETLNEEALKKRQIETAPKPKGKNK